MRVLFATQAERTHFLGLVPLAWALRAAGHEVRVASQPHLESVAAGAGLPFTAVGRDHHFARISRDGRADRHLDFDMAEDRDEVLTWDHLLQGYRGVVTWWWRTVNDPMFDDLVALCRQWRPDLVVWEPSTYAAPVAARACGAAHVRHLWSVDLFSRVRRTFLARMGEQPASRREDPLAEWLGARAARHGVDFSESLVHGQATVEQVPAPLRVDTPPHLEYLPVRYVPYNGRAVVPDWLRTPPDRPRIGLSLGTTAALRLGGYTVDVATLLEGLAGLDVEVVATLPASEREKLGAVPGNARLVEYVPLHALAPTCAAMVTHGGPGTVLTGLAHGVPQLLSPNARMFDIPVLAGLVEGAGAGRVVDPDRLDAATVTEGVRALLEDPRHAKAAHALRERMDAMPAPADLARTLTRLTRT
ncbi:activator-dependent family glycosyltransferase [Nocardiopsis sp. HUAS JQ3]|uniref:activator-dependent family glycosyltransferase n=1 Tax=Nocardiopsis sp. HUAS JQ3 TaxID=3061629 RepID=UPI0023A98479|nr:activator-dependent family glycosyltransferase [Nocardiopsis sp. HUAS JQ3]WDZ90864.1 activator-dependent family glycosyltransferase [Nocardiopsis sp. HUAS JQ3]